MIEINIDLGDTIAQLKKTHEKLKNMTPLMAAMADTMHEAVIDNFDAQGRPKWAALSGLTEERRKRMGYSGKPILENSGTLKTRIESHYDSNSAVVGTNTIYAAIQHFGGEIKPKKGKYLTIPLGKNPKTGKQEYRKVKKVVIPPRPFLSLTDADRANLEELAQDYFEN
jgi:phage virion morphogenesis protein